MKIYTGKILDLVADTLDELKSGETSWLQIISYALVIVGGMGLFLFMPSWI